MAWLLWVLSVFFGFLFTQRRTNRRTRKDQRIFLSFERLEDRVVPAPIINYRFVWIGKGSDPNWSDAKNWDNSLDKAGYGTPLASSSWTAAANWHQEQAPGPDAAAVFVRSVGRVSQPAQQPE